MSSSTTLRVALFGIKLRAECVAHFLHEARTSTDPATMSALAYHAADLRRRCERARRDA